MADGTAGKHGIGVVTEKQSSEETNVKPTYQNVWNLNTLVMLAGFSAVLVAWGVTWGNLTSRVDAMDAKFAREIARIDSRSESRIQTTDARWREHDQLHRDRASESAASWAKSDERFRGLEAELRKMDNLSYRIQVQEQSTATLAKTVEEIRAAINTLATDMRIVREILQPRPGGANST